MKTIYLFLFILLSCQSVTSVPTATVNASVIATTAPKFTTVISSAVKVAPDTSKYRFSVRWFVQASTVKITHLHIRGTLINATPITYSVAPDSTTPNIVWLIDSLNPNVAAVRNIIFDIPKTYFNSGNGAITSVWRLVADGGINIPVSGITNYILP